MMRKTILVPLRVFIPVLMNEFNLFAVCAQRCLRIAKWFTTPLKEELCLYL